METRDDDKYKEYCKYRNQVKDLTRKAIRNKEKEIAKEVKKKTKKFWQYTQSKTKTRTGISDLVMIDEDENETLTKTDKDKANTLSNFFSSVFTTENYENSPTLEDILVNQEMKERTILEEKVKNV